MARQTVYMGTTGISPQQTAAEIQSRLARAKAKHINSEYAGGEVIAMRFSIDSPNGELWFRLPVRWEPLWKYMRQNQSANIGQDQAKRTAWRQILRWVEAQLALIDVNSSAAFEVFLPYMVDGNDVTVAELFADKHGMKLLPSGSAKP